MTESGRTSNITADGPRVACPAIHSILIDVTSVSGLCAAIMKEYPVPFTMYRADTRTPGEIKKAGGFQAKVPLTVAQAQGLIRRVSIDATFPVDIPHRAMELRDALADPAMAGKLFGLLALYQGIRKGKSGTTVHISTSANQGTGGYDGNIYEIVTPFVQLYETPAKRNGLGDPRLVASYEDMARGVNPSILTDRDNIDSAAELIAVYNSGQGSQEVAFLTDIPLKWIERVKLDGSQDWQMMSAVLAGSSSATS